MQQVLFTEGRNYLLGKEGNRVGLVGLEGKIVGLYFSAHWCPPCKVFTPLLAEVYKELVAQGKPLEIVFVSSDSNEDEFSEYYNEMPWLAKPNLTKIEGIPSLVILAPDGTKITDEGRDLVEEHGTKVFPFCPENVKALKDDSERKHAELVANMSAMTLLGTPIRTWVSDPVGTHIDISSLHGRPLGILFLRNNSWCTTFNSVLKEAYDGLKAQNKAFEVVCVSMDESEENSCKDTQWLIVPFDKILARKLWKFFTLSRVPSLVILNECGKMVTTSAASYIDDFGADAYPFTDEVINVLRTAKAERLRLARENQSVSSLLGTPTRDYLINGARQNIPVSSLVENERIGLYFSAHWCGPCCAFTPVLVKVYNELKAAGKKFEVVFISADNTQSDFDGYFADMPWLALPYSDRKSSKNLKEHFELEGIPTLVLLNSAGKTLSLEGKDAVSLSYGGTSAFPWTPERLAECKAGRAAAMEALPKWIRHSKHEQHPLQLLPFVYQYGEYYCDACGGEGDGFTYHCAACQWDSHPSCAVGMPPCDPLAPASPQNGTSE
ncbi:nucleoredoxin 1 [Pelomyxa schiedti]|nr:nucleoredoxin 1 [Pelomyxa schiedti]